MPPKRARPQTAAAAAEHPAAAGVEEKATKPSPRAKGKSAAAVGDDAGDAEAGTAKNVKKGKSKVADADDADADDAGDGGPASATAKKPKPSREMVARSPTPRLPAPKGPSFTAVSWNVGGLRSIIKTPAKLAVFTRVVDEVAADAFCLQETKLNVADESAARAALIALLPGWEAHFHSSAEKKGYSGTGVLLRTPTAGGPKPIRVIPGLPGFPEALDGEGRLMTIEYDRFYLINVYTPNAGQGLKRLDFRVGEWDAAFGKAVVALPKPAAVIGDLNVAHRDADVYNPTAKHLPKGAGTTPQERASFTKILADNELVDAFRHLHPTAVGAYSYWSVRASNRASNSGMRLDYAIVPRSMLDSGAAVRLHDAFLLDEHNEFGDHAPVGLTLTL